MQEFFMIGVMLGFLTLLGLFAIITVSADVPLGAGHILKKCAKDNDVYECVWVAEPKQ